MKVILRLHGEFTARWQIKKLFTALRSTLKQTYFKLCLPEFLSFWICSLSLVAVIFLIIIFKKKANDKKNKVQHLQFRETDSKFTRKSDTTFHHVIKK